MTPGLGMLLFLFVYALLSAVTFIVYAVDKKASIHNKQRTPEKTLHLLALLGGWPGALYAQQALRHKSRKTRFRRVFWLTIAINVLTVVVVSSWSLL